MAKRTKSFNFLYDMKPNERPGADEANQDRLTMDAGMLKYFATDWRKTAGLVYGWHEGVIGRTKYPGGSVQVNPNSATYFEVNVDTGQVSWNESGFSGFALPLAIVRSDASEITDVDDMRSPPVGKKGEKGDQGEGIRVKGKLGSLDELNAIQKPTIGDTYILKYDDRGFGWMWTGAEWFNTGPITGPHGITVFLSSYSHVFPADQKRALWSSTGPIYAAAFQSKKRLPVHIGEIEGILPGMTVEIVGNDTENASFCVEVAGVMSAGCLSVPLTVDEKLFSQIFSWGLALTGPTGPQAALATLEDTEARALEGIAVQPAGLVNFPLKSEVKSGIADAVANIEATVNLFKTEILNALGDGPGEMPGTPEIPYASYEAAGVVKLATLAEAEAKTNPEKAVPPAALANFITEAYLMGELTPQLTNLLSGIDAIKTQLTSTQSAITAINTKVTALDTKMTTLEGSAKGWRTVREVIEVSKTWTPPTGLRDRVVWIEYGCSSGNGLYSEPDSYYPPGLQVFWRKIQLSNMNSVNVTIPPGGMYGGASTAFGGYLTIQRNEAFAIINGNIEVQGGLRVLFYNLYSVMGLAYPGIKAGASHIPSNADIWGAGATPQSYGFSGPGVLILVYQVPE